MGGKTLMIDPG